MPDEKPQTPPPPPLPALTAPEQEEGLRTSGQRRVNIIWEVTQAVIAVFVTVGTVFVSGILIVRDGNSGAATAFLLLSNAFFMIVTSYFQRTNHTRSGGVGGPDVKTTR